MKIKREGMQIKDESPSSMTHTQQVRAIKLQPQQQNTDAEFDMRALQYEAERKKAEETQIREDELLGYGYIFNMYLLTACSIESAHLANPPAKKQRCSNQRVYRDEWEDDDINELYSQTLNTHSSVHGHIAYRARRLPLQPLVDAIGMVLVQARQDFERCPDDEVLVADLALDLQQRRSLWN